MKIGLYDVDSHNFPNLALMKISAYHKSLGHQVEWLNRLEHYDKVYISKVFGDEYSQIDRTVIDADEIIWGGTGFAITVENGKEVYHKDRDTNLPYEIEHIYPDYSLYPELTKNKAFGFLTRGCCNNCEFCLVSKKEGICSTKVADLTEWWSGQKEIILLDPNILACKDRINLLQQLADSGAKVEFNQGLDARFVTPKVAEKLKTIKTKTWHFAFDFMKNEKKIVKGLKTFVNIVQPNRRDCKVYVLTNYDTTFAEDWHRIELIREIGLNPDIRIYRKPTAPPLTRDLQRWCNNRFVFESCPNFMEYVPRSDGKTIEELYFKGERHERIKKNNTKTKKRTTGTRPSDGHMECGTEVSPSAVDTLPAIPPFHEIQEKTYKAD